MKTFTQRGTILVSFTFKARVFLRRQIVERARLTIYKKTISNLFNINEFDVPARISSLKVGIASMKNKLEVLADRFKELSNGEIGQSTLHITHKIETRGELRAVLQ